MSALNGMRVLDLSITPAGEYCARLLADFGAEVIKLEPPGGSPTRRNAPLIGAADGASISGLFEYLNAGKASVTVDPDSADGRSVLLRLAATADAVIDDHRSGWLAKAGFGEESRDETFPKLVVCAITPYGQAAGPGPKAAEDLNVFHASGWGYHTPSASDGTRSPLKGAGRHLASYEAALDAALCVVAALYRREISGSGDFIDISRQAVLASRIDYVLGQMVAGDMDVMTSRTALDLWGPSGIFACRQGYAFFWLSDRGHWGALRALIGDPAWMDEFPEDWLSLGVTPERVARCRAEISAWLAGQDRDEIAARAQRVGLQIVPLNAPSDLYVSEQYASRGFFAEVEHRAAGKIGFPGVPYRLSVTPARIAGPAPALGQQNASVLGDGL